ncbi:MAG: hypothetical protein MUD12_12155 [Spirochaetes bacterium]|jgi:hypothetical protein|nr:hypothetical protein [Spirochaetota bacterium]
MRKIGLITAGIISAIIIVVLFLVAPGIMRENAVPLLMMIPVIAVLIAIGAVIGRSIKKKHDLAFREVLAGLGLEYGSFYNILYAYGKYRGLYVGFKYSRITKNDLAPLLPGDSTLVILCRVKLPGTENRRLHLAVFPADRGRAVRNILGWTNPEPGVYLARVKDQSETDARMTFSRISRTTLEKMKGLAESTGSCAVSTDWETVMIGKKNALKLLGGDEQALSRLDFQVKIPLKATREEMKAFLDEMTDIAAELAGDLRG